MLLRNHQSYYKSWKKFFREEGDSYEKMSIAVLDKNFSTKTNKLYIILSDSKDIIVCDFIRNKSITVIDLYEYLKHVWEKKD